MFKIGNASAESKIWSVSITTTSTTTSTSTKPLPLSKSVQYFNHFDHRFHSGICSGAHCFNCLPFPGIPVWSRPLQGVSANKYIHIYAHIHISRQSFVFVCESMAFQRRFWWALWRLSPTFILSFIQHFFTQMFSFCFALNMNKWWINLFTTVNGGNDNMYKYEYLV